MFQLLQYTAITMLQVLEPKRSAIVRTYNVTMYTVSEKILRGREGKDEGGRNMEAEGRIE